MGMPDLGSSDRSPQRPPSPQADVERQQRSFEGVSELTERGDAFSAFHSSFGPLGIPTRTGWPMADVVAKGGI
eukprot:1618195-Prymnesium_polylepis.1